MDFRRSIAVGVWDETVWPKALAYWEEHEFVFEPGQNPAPKETTGGASSSMLHPEQWVGRRGSWWGNLTSFNAKKLVTKLTLSRTGEAEMLCNMEVNTSFQMVTPRDQEKWQEELEGFALLFETHRTLLRASTAPGHDPQSILLRPTTTPSPTPTDQLLRPTSPEE